jgi:hypothetical protein
MVHAATYAANKVHLNYRIKAKRYDYQLYYISRWIKPNNPESLHHDPSIITPGTQPYLIECNPLGPPHHLFQDVESILEASQVLHGRQDLADQC